MDRRHRPLDAKLTASVARPPSPRPFVGTHAKKAPRSSPGGAHSSLHARPVYITHGLSPLRRWRAFASSAPSSLAHGPSYSSAPHLCFTRVRFASPAPYLRFMRPVFASCADLLCAVREPISFRGRASLLLSLSFRHDACRCCRRSTTVSLSTTVAASTWSLAFRDLLPVGPVIAHGQCRCQRTSIRVRIAPQRVVATICTCRQPHFDWPVPCDSSSRPVRTKEIQKNGGRLT